MSYTRWNTVINPRLSINDVRFLLINGVPLKKIQYISSRNRKRSKWYIFWDIASGETKEEQVLSCWLSGAEHFYSINYEQAVYMLETYDYSILGYGDNISQINILFDCISRWVEDVNNDFKEEN